MRKASVFLVMSVMVLAFGTAAMAVNVYNNDFGTTDQFNALSWTATSGLEQVADLYATPGDLDGDGLQAAIRCTSSYVNWRYGTKAIYAAPFTVLSNPSVSGYGAGFIGSHSSGASWSLSQDAGTTREYTATTDNTNAWKSYSTLSAATDEDYTSVSRFYATAGVKHYSGGAYTIYNTGRTGALQVSADSSLGQVGDIVNLTRNDFGTTAQRNEWTITNSTPMVYTDSPSYDHDMDDLAAACGIGAIGSATLITQIDAPAGMAFMNPVATARGYGSTTYWGSSANVSFSTDGVTWEHTSSQPGGVYGYFDIETGDTSADANYQNLSTLYVKISLSAGNAVGYPNIRDLGITAELVPEPATLVLLALGGIATLRRRR